MSTVGCHSLTTTTHPSNVSLPSSGQPSTTRLSALKVSAAVGDRPQDPLLRDATVRPNNPPPLPRAKLRPEMCQAAVHHSVYHHFIVLVIRYNTVYISNTALDIYH